MLNKGPQSIMIVKVKFNGKSLSDLARYSVLYSLEEVYLLILDTKQNEKPTSTE